MLDIQWKGLEELEAALDPKLVRKAMVRALNRVALKAFTAIKKYLREKYTLKAKDISKQVKVSKARQNSPVAFIIATGTNFPLIAFQAKQTKRGVTVKIKKSSGRKLVKGRPGYKGKTFIATMGSGHKGVFQKTGEVRKMERGRYIGKKRGVIAELYSINVPKVIGTKAALNLINKVVADNLDKEFNRAYDFYIESAKRRAAVRTHK